MLVIGKCAFEDQLYHLTSLMEEESPAHSESDNFLTDAELLHLITAACCSASNQEAAAASHKILSHLNPPLVNQLIELLAAPATSQEVKRDISHFLRNCSEEMRERQCDSLENAFSLLCYIVSDLDSETKKFLRQLFFHFIREGQFEQGQLFNEGFTEILGKIEDSPQEIKRLEVYIEFFKEMKENIRGHGDNLDRIIRLIPKFANELSKELEGLTGEQFQQKWKQINQRIKDVLSVFNGEIEHFGEIYSFGMQQSVMSYLLLFSRGDTLVAHIPPCPLSKPEGPIFGLKCISEACKALLSIKNELIQEMIKQNRCWDDPYQFCELMLKTIINCSQYIDNRQFQKLMKNCAYVVQNNLYRLKQQLDTQKCRIKFLSALLLLISSPDSQLAKIKKNPQGFISEADECFRCESEFRSMLTFKSVAIFLLMKFLEDFQYKEIFVEDMLFLLNDALHPNHQQGESRERVEIYKKFTFYKLSQDKRLDSLLVLLGVFAQYATFNNEQQSEDGKEERCIEKFNSFIDKNIDTLISIQSPIVTLRLIRILRYYYSSGRFECVSKEFWRGKVFQLEGFTLVLRYLRTSKRQKNLILFFITNFEEIIESIKYFRDDWFHLLVGEFHGDIIKGNYKTTQALAKRIKRQFSARTCNQYSSECLSMLEEMIIKEDNQKVNFILYQTFCELYSIASNDPTRLSKIEGKLGLIGILLLEKFQKVKTFILQLGLKTLTNLKGKLDQFDYMLRYFNIYFRKVKITEEQIQSFYSTFFYEINSKLPPAVFLRGTQSLQNARNYSYLMTQLIVMNPEVCLRDQGILTLFYMLKQSPHSQKQCILGIILTYAYMRTEQFVNFLNENPYSRAFFRNILHVEIKERIFAKIFNLACIKVIEFSDYMIIRGRIMLKFLDNMRGICRTHDEMPKNSKNPKLKGVYVRSHNALAPKKTTIVDHFAKFKHPLQQVNEFEAFKQLYMKKKQLIEDKLTQKQAIELRRIIQTSELSNQIGMVFEEDDD